MKLSQIVAAVKGQTEEEEKALRGLGWTDKDIDSMSARQIEIILKKKTQRKRRGSPVEALSLPKFIPGEPVVREEDYERMKHRGAIKKSVELYNNSKWDKFWFKWKEEAPELAKRFKGPSVPFVFYSTLGVAEDVARHGFNVVFLGFENRMAKWVAQRVKGLKVKKKQKEGATVQADQQVAKTILQQMGGINRIKAMLGVKQFVSMKDGVQFKFPSPHGGPNFVKIVLDPSDTYTMTFGRVRGTQFKKGKEHSGIYADQLRKIFEKETGLYLKL
jgi:hypothetical protein